MLQGSRVILLQLYAKINYTAARKSANVGTRLWPLKAQFRSEFRKSLISRIIENVDSSIYTNIVNLPKFEAFCENIYFQSLETVEL